jgi:methyl-accepting chemotaxis protein
VAADKVRNLAIRSADALENTINLTVLTIGNINACSELARRTSLAFELVVTEVKNVSDIISEVTPGHPPSNPRHRPNRHRHRG